MPHSPDGLIWDGELPSLEQLYERGGVPGFEYLLCSVGNEFKAQTEGGYKRTKNSPVFQLNGPSGELHFVVMERGEWARYVSPDMSRQVCHVDEALLQHVEMVPAPVPKALPEPTAPKVLPVLPAEPGIQLRPSAAKG